MKNAAMLSDVNDAVTSQTGVLDLPFVRSRAAGRFPRHGGGPATEEIEFVRPALHRQQMRARSSLSSGFSGAVAAIAQLKAPEA